MEKLSTSAPVGDFQRSQRPPKTNGSPPRLRMYIGCLPPAVFCHSKKPSAKTRHRRFLNEVRKLGFVATVSPRAFMRLLPIFASFAQNGINPHLNCLSVRWPSSDSTITHAV